MKTGNKTNAGQTWGAPIHSEWVAVTSHVTGGTVFFSEQPGETITQQRGNLLLRVSLNITIFPSESFSAFETANGTYTRSEERRVSAITP